MIKAGDLAPDFSLRQIDGSVGKLEELRADGNVLLAFYKVSCPTCKLTLPYLHRVQVKTIGISQDNAAATAKFSEQYGVVIPSLLDPEADDYPVSTAYGIHHVPTFFLIDESGKVLERVGGFDKDMLERLGVEFGAAETVPVFKPG